MNCENLRIRTLKYQKYIFCTIKHKEIIFKDCIDCKHKEYKDMQEIKKKGILMDKIKFIKESLENDLDYWESGKKEAENIGGNTKFYEGATAGLRALKEKIKFVLKEGELKK